MALRRNSKVPLLVAAAALGSFLAAAPAQAAPPRAHVGGVTHGCHWRHVDGHWVWVDGERHWVPPRSVRVCG